MPATRDVIRPKPAPQRRGTVIDIHLNPDPLRRSARASMRIADAAMDRLARGIRDLGRTQDQLSASVSRLHDAVAPIAAARQAMRDADAAYEARAAHCTPAAVQASNAARWPRPGR